MRTPLTPFKVMTSLLNNTTPTSDEIGTMNSFFACRWLSNNKHTLPMANTINRHYNIPVNVQYKFYEDYIYLTNMKNDVKFISFSKDKQDKNFIKLMENIQRKYNIGVDQAQIYYNLMTNEQKNEIYNLYNEGIK